MLVMIGDVLNLKVLKGRQKSLTKFFFLNNKGILKKNVNHKIKKI